MTKRNVVYNGLEVASATVIEAGRFVKFDSNGQGIRAVADDYADGISAEATADGETRPISYAELQGTLKVTAGAAVSAGAIVRSDAQGRAIPHSGSGARLGRAKTAAAAAGDTIEISAWIA